MHQRKRAATKVPEINGHIFILLLKTTNYCSPSTETTLKKAAGIVKAVGLFEKNPCQYAADHETNERLLRDAFFEGDKF